MKERKIQPQYTAADIEKHLTDLRANAQSQTVARQYEDASENLLLMYRQTRRKMCEAAAQAWKQTHAELSEQEQQWVDWALNDPDHLRAHALFEKLKSPFTPGVHLTVGNLTEHSRALAQIILSNAIHHPVADEGDKFTWRMEAQYATTLIFAVDDDTTLCHDKDGWTVDPARMLDCPCLSADLHLDPSAHTLSVLPGKYWEDADKKHYFQPMPFDHEAPHFLVQAQWGGASSKLRGINPESKLMEQVGGLFFEKMSSQKGGEGCDYYVLPIELVKGDRPCSAVTEAVLVNHVWISTREAIFHEKLALLEKIERDRAELHEAIAAANERLEGIYQKVRQAPCLERSFVEAPEIEAITVPEEALECSLDSSLEELEQFANDTALRKLIDKCELMGHIRCLAWLRFAPRFAELANTVYGFYGRIEIRGDEVLISLPSATEESPAEGEMPTKRFTFSEQQLNLALSMLEAYSEGEATAAARNAERLAILRRQNEGCTEELVGGNVGDNGSSEGDSK